MGGHHEENRCPDRRAADGRVPGRLQFPGAARRAVRREWESTGGEQIQMRVDPPADDQYPVQITGEGVDLSLSAKETGDQVYEAKSTSAVWTFRMVDDDLLNATGTPEGQAATTSFKRIGG